MARVRGNGKLGWFPWYPRDWKAENSLRGTSIVVRGIWREMLDAMFVDQACSLSGDVAELAAIADCEIDEMEQFLETAKHRKFCNVTECNGTFTVISRRFAKEEEDRELAREQTRLRVQKHRQKKAHVTEVTKKGDVTPLHSSVSDSVSVSDSGSGSRKKKRKGVSPIQYTEEFEKRFWAIYPRKDGKADAFELWQDLSPEDRDRAAADVPSRVANNWATRPVDKMPYGSTYLSKRLFEDPIQGRAENYEENLRREYGAG